MPRPRADDEVEGQDEEFLFHLNRGAELLAKGEPLPAGAALGRAVDLRPKDSKALGLLGQAWYKAGRFEDAVEAYGRLVDENPVEAAARVNLGLANLKAKRHAEAVRQLGVALDLSPGHKKAMGYLGLAHLEMGDFTTAREWFVQAGSDQMVARCDELLALERQRPAPPAATPSRGTPPPAAGPTLAVSAGAAGEPQATPFVPAVPEAPSVPAGTPTLAAFADARALLPEAIETFAVGRGLLTVAVHGEVLCRGRGLAAVRGSVRLSPEMKRFRGKGTDKPFGEGSDRMLRASGEGALLYRAGARRLTVLDLGGESGYFREEALFAFEGALAFENGRVASRLGADLNLVHLRGRGRFLLSSAGELMALRVSPDASLRVPMTALAGWSGNLTPRLSPLAEVVDADPATPLVVELSGDGRVLLDSDSAPGSASQA